MKKLIAGILLTIVALHLSAQSQTIYNIGAILDTPFLYQNRYPLESEYEGGYFQRMVYTYDTVDGFERPLPTVITMYDAWDEQTGEIAVIYEDGQLSGMIFSGEDYRDVYDYTEYGQHGPTVGTITTTEGDIGITTITYDANGLVRRIEEENPYEPDTLWYVAEHRWTETEAGTRPLAVMVELDGSQIEYYRHLYDARGRLIHLLGDAYYEDQPEENAYSETYIYRDDQTRFFFLD